MIYTSGAPTTAGQEWRRGWGTVLAAFAGLYLSVTFLHSIGLFFGPLETEFGWTREDISIGVSVASLSGASMHLVAGALVDRFGARRIAIPATVLYVISLAVISRAGPGIWSWWLSSALVGIAFGLTSSVVWLTAVISRFEVSRGAAVAAVQVGPALAMATMPIIMKGLIDVFGWRGAYLTCAALGLIVVLPLITLWFFDERLAQKLDQAGAGTEVAGLSVRQIFTSSRFWRLAFATYLAVFGMFGLSIHFVPLLGDFGFERFDAAWIASFIGIGSITGRVLCGFLLDRLPANLIGGIAFALPAAGCLVLLQLTGQSSTIYFALTAFLLGLSLGGEIDSVAYLASRNFGLRNYGTAFGFIAACMSLGSGTGSWLAGAMHDRLGSYRLFEAGLVGTFLLAGALVASLPRRPEAELPS